MYNKQFYDMENIIFNPNPETLIKVQHIFKFMNKIINLNQENILEKPEGLRDSLAIIPSIINSYENTGFLLLNGPTFEPSIKQDPRKVLICESKNFYEGILSIYYNSNRPIPKSDQVMFCNFFTN